MLSNLNKRKIIKFEFISNIKCADINGECLCSLIQKYLIIYY